MQARLTVGYEVTCSVHTSYLWLLQHLDASAGTLKKRKQLRKKVEKNHLTKITAISTISLLLLCTGWSEERTIYRNVMMSLPSTTIEQLSERDKLPFTPLELWSPLVNRYSGRSFAKCSLQVVNSLAMKWLAKG